MFEVCDAFITIIITDRSDVQSEVNALLCRCSYFNVPRKPREYYKKKKIKQTKLTGKAYFRENSFKRNS